MRMPRTPRLPLAPRPTWTVAIAMLLAMGATALRLAPAADQKAASEASQAEPDRSPVALALSSDGTRLLTANMTSGTVSLVDALTGTVLAEVATGEKPAGVGLSKDGRHAAVANWYGYDLAVLEVGPRSLKVVGHVAVGPEPRGVAVSPDGKIAYVAVGVANEVVKVDLDARSVVDRLPVGREPRGLALSPDGKVLVVGNSRSQTVSVIDTAAWKIVRTTNIEGDNLRQIALSSDGTFAYLANMKNRKFATTANNIDQGWVLGQRLTRVRLQGEDEYATISLDPQGRAAGDAHGVAVSGDGKHIAVSCGGTHEVMLFRTDRRRLPWRINGARDLMHVELLRGDGRFRRVATGGRPTEVAFAPDGKTLYVANYFANAIQVIDAEEAQVVRTINLGGASEPSLARRGEMLFHDATRSFNQWYSCATCHSDGHTNGLDFDTLNDGRQDLSTSHRRSRKKVPTLRGVVRTGPWTWHGWQDSLDDAMVESFTKSMQGRRPREEDVKAIVAYLATLDYPRNPYRQPDGSLNEAARRGEAVFKSAKAACNTCHGGPELTDGKIHVVGLEERDDAYQGYNPPSLKGLYDKDPYLHDGRAKTLHEVLTGAHSPDAVNGGGDLSAQELDDLIAYLRSL
ncbi:MAG: beta-propeller fold lactonase family protein [Isosphaeraceae bacterium]